MQELLRDPSQREAAGNANPQARGSLENAKALTHGDPKNEQELFELTSSIADKFVKQNDGDPQKMQQALSDLQRNPQLMGGLMDSADREKLRGLRTRFNRRPSNRGSEAGAGASRR